MAQMNSLGKMPAPDQRALSADAQQGSALDYLREMQVHANTNYPGQEQLQESAGFDLQKYYRIFNKHRRMIAGITGAAVVAAAVITFLMTPIYRATASIQIDREAMNVMKVDGLQLDDAQVGSMEFYQTQYELLGSRSLAGRVVSSMSLLNDPTFTKPKKSLVGSVMGLLHLSDSDADADGAADTKSRQVTDRLLKVLSISPVRGSKIVKISIDHPNPATAQKLANGYAEAFIADNLDRRYDATSYARKFLEDRLQQLKVKLEDSEKQMVKYAQDQGIISIDDGKSLSSSDLEAINGKLGDIRTERIKKELLWKQAQATDGIGLKEILDSPAIQENLKQKAQLESEYQEKLSTFKPAFPAMLELKSRIKELDRQIGNAASAIKQSIEASYLASKGEEERLQAQLDASKNEVVDQRNRSIQYNILKREVDTNRALYDGLLQRYKEIGVAGGIGTNNVSVVDRATQPKDPRSPVLWLNIAIAALGGLVLGGLIALGLDHLDDSFKSPEDLERELGIAVIGIVPTPGPGSSIEQEMADPRSGMAEAYRSLRTGLQFSTSEGLPRTLLMTSSKPSEGKTTTSINIAEALSHIGLSVLLIDADLRNASVHKRLGISNEMGLTNYLTGNKPPEEVVQATANEKLVIMTSGMLPPNPAELLIGPKFPALLTLAAESFDVVIVDGPPVMGLADAPIISNMMQATLMVVAANETTRDTAKTALRRLGQARANVIGAILNKFDLKHSGYGYGYGEYGYYGYGNDTPQLTESEA
ncbi:GumC family protein [Aestuariivirga litoralis]|uniref:GumC family protein n=1 Tax=Aestuariivirga litoralis TaxID=2650924 RepID=UPI0018C5A0CB|nr:polysaccharide biosynthesis tyrosine autokinase [Aestuariivirga litoralis]MBG1233222.1 polysaccharide biosynthesis tyrosine autokinase [Aestuariivirga litoralis]